MAEVVDPIAAVLCGVAATLVGFGHGQSLGGWLLLAAGFYGIARASGSRAAPWLIGAVGAAFLLSETRELVDPSFSFAEEHPTLVAAPTWIANRIVEATFLAAVVVAQRRSGFGLFALAVGAAGIALAFGMLSDALEPKAGEPNSFAFTLVEGIDRGWSVLSSRLEMVVFLVLGLGAPAVSATPRRPSAVAGAIAASLLAATLAAFPKVGDYVVCIATAAAAWVAMAVAIGRLRGIGGGGAAIAGLVLVILQVLALGLVMVGMEDASSRPIAFTMGLGLGFLGLGIAVFVPSALPLPRVRYLIGGAFLIASAGATLALARHVGKVRSNPYWGATALGEPAGVIGFVLLAAYFAFLAAPPEAPAADQRGR